MTTSPRTFRGSVRGSTKASVRDSVRDSFRGSLRDSFKSSLQESLKGSLKDSYPGSVRSSLFSLSSLDCPLHPGKYITMVCVTCRDELVCPTCIKVDHRRHEFQELEDIFEDKEVVAPLHIEDADSILKQVRHNIGHLEGEVKEYDVQVDRVIGQIRDRGRELKASIDSAMNETIATCESMRRDSGKKLKKVLERLQRLEKEIAKHMKEGQSLVLSRFDTNLIGLPRTAPSDNKEQEPTRPWWSSFLVHIPKFVTAQTSPDDLRIIFGVISKEDISVSSISSAEIGEAYNFFNPENLSDSGKKEPLERFPYKVSESDREIMSICPMNNNSAWVLNRGSDEVHLVSSLSGENVRTVTTNGVEICDVTSAIDRSMTVICCTDRSIHEIGGSYPNTKILFFTEFVPSSLIVTKDHFIVVAFNPGGLIIQFDDRGNLLHKIRGAMSGRIDLDSPKPLRIRQSFHNQDMGVFNKGSGYLTILDHRMRVKFHSACGKKPLNGKFIHTGGISNFMIGDTCFDSVGNIYIVDTTRNSIIVLDKRGSILRTVVSKHNKRPTSVGVQPDGRIWMGYEDGTVQIRKPYNS